MNDYKIYYFNAFNILRFYFFHLGAEMGHENFYTLLFLSFFWYIDEAIARKIITIWIIYLYIGQSTKDLIALPRPASPPGNK